MKTLKYLLLAVVAFMAVSCADEVYTPQTAGDGDDDPIIIGGGGGGGAGNPGGGGGRMRGNQTSQDSVIVVNL